MVMSSFRRYISVGLALATSVSLMALPALVLPSMAPAAAAQAMQPLQGYVVTVPAGTSVQAQVQSGVDSGTARAGDRVVVSIASPVMSGGAVAIPAGSQVEGQVISVTSAGRAGRNGQLDIRFSQAMLPSGQRIPISARIQTEDGSGILKGGTARGRAGSAAVRTGGAAALGAALGTAMGPLSGGSVGRGAVFGTALGAGLGALAAGVNKGDEVRLNSGESLSLVLDAPVSANAGASASSQQYNNYGAAPYNAGYSQQQQYQYSQGNSQGYSQGYQQPVYQQSSGYQQQPQTYGQTYQQQSSGSFYTPQSGSSGNTYNASPYNY